TRFSSAPFDPGARNRPQTIASAAQKTARVLAVGDNMAEILECFVTYCSEDTNDEGMPRRYLAYHVVAGAGPKPEGGVASITPLAAYYEIEVCAACERVFAVKAGGPTAAIEEALLYLAAYHETDELRKVQSEIRKLAVRTDAAGS